MFVSFCIRVVSNYVLEMYEKYVIYSIVVIVIVKIIYQIKPSIFEFVYLNVGFFPIVNKNTI